MTYDVSIVGAGSAGAVLATRLSGDPQRSVLLLEAGMDDPTLDTLPNERKFGWSTGADLRRSRRCGGILSQHVSCEQGLPLV